VSENIIRYSKRATAKDDGDKDGAGDCEKDEDGKCKLPVLATVDITYEEEPVEIDYAITPNMDETLSSCIYDLLKNRFANVNVHGTMRNASNVWFSPGTSWAVQTYDWITSSQTDAITIGLTVHYDTDALPNLSKPSWAQFETMIEEIAHVNQFLVMWGNMPVTTTTTKGRTMVGREKSDDMTTRLVPTYSQAITQWGINYAAAVLNTPKGQDSYADNSIEKSAKKEARDIRIAIQNQSKDSYGPCGK
jgi:hypothetical protein